VKDVFASKDFLAGNLYIAFGLAGLWFGRDLEGGSTEAMGAGYFPRLVCGLLIALGLALAAMSLIQPSEHPDRARWRPFAFVTLACLAFALLLHPLGMVLTLAIVIVLARLAEPNLRVVPLLLLCFVLIVANVGIFVLALRIPIPLWPAAF
jgi:putative tricarboxylic transport membrane protein